MRVALTSESSLPYLSGVTVSVDALARGLGALGHQVLVVGPRPAHGEGVVAVGSSGPEPEYAWLPSYQLPAIAPRGYRMPWPTPLADAWRRAQAFGPDVVHAHSPFVTGLLARRLARAVDAPLVFTHHTRFADYRHYLGPLAGPGAALTESYLGRFWAGCAAIVAPSHDLAQEIRSRLPAARRDRVLVIPTGIDVDAIRSSVRIDPRSAAGWPPESLVVGSLGRLAPEKRPELVLDAMERVAAEEPRARLLVIGGGPSEPALRARAEDSGLAGRVAFTGHVARPEALARVAGCDVFAFVSRTETQGLVLAEALAAGLPAVAVDGPGVRDSVRDGIDGIVVAAEPASTVGERLATTIAELLADRARRAELAARAGSDADRFAIERRVGEVVEMYRSVARGASAESLA
ncbi:MAG TPA: glycosyltransferase [Candidatus Limnocylindria bacterium]|nr:glycosyltransferase [Candidatus Limnocylindria bacterium]